MTQRDGLARPLQQRNRNALVIAGALIAVAVVIGVFAAPSLPAIASIGILVVVLGIAFSLLLRVLTGADKALGRDLRAGQVKAVTGSIIREQESAMDLESTSVSILKVGDERFTVTAAIFNSAPRGGVVRLYYLPASRKVVNLEALNDGMTNAAPRPLVEAIIGSWRNNFAKATFTPDGHVTASVMGRQSDGQWSVDAEGRLHAQIAGRTEIAEASIAGDELSVTLAGRVVTLLRSA